MAFRAVGKVTVPGLAIATGYWSAGARIRAGENPARVILSETARGILYTTMGVIPATLVDMGPGLAKAAGAAGYRHYQNNQITQRAVRNSFSQSFTHSDASIAAQQMGMRAIGAGSSVIGTEAGLMARRYMRG